MRGPCGWLALNLLLKGQYVQAEPLAKEAVAITDKEQPEDPGHFYWLGLLGAVLLGQQRFSEAEPLLLQSYEAQKNGQATYFVENVNISEVGGWIVRFYDTTKQPEKARAWREKLGFPPGSKGLWTFEQDQAELVPLPRELP